MILIVENLHFLRIVNVYKQIGEGHCRNGTTQIDHATGTRVVESPLTYT